MYPCGQSFQKSFFLNYYENGLLAAATCIPELKNREKNFQYFYLLFMTSKKIAENSAQLIPAFST
jgi:hypothetical protein